MARGFATGLFHGALVGAAGLGLLSLVLPAPQDASGRAPAPEAEVIATPAGSEFGRGEDAAPALPGPLTRPEPAPLGQAPAAAAPADAPLSEAPTATAARPETGAEGPAAPAEVEPLAEIGAMPAPSATPAEAPAMSAAPERFENPAPDPEPAALPVSEPVPAELAAPAEESAETPRMPAASATGQPVTRPALPTPPPAEAPADMSALTGDDMTADMETDQARPDPQADPASEAGADSGAAPAAAGGPEMALQPLPTHAGDDISVGAAFVDEPTGGAGPSPSTDGARANQSGKEAAGATAPALNLSTPPDIGGLLAGQ